MGKDVTLEEGYQAARITGLYLLATTRQALGSLDKVKRAFRGNWRSEWPVIVALAILDRQVVLAMAPPH